MKESFLQRLVRERDEALTKAVMESDLTAFDDYCTKYGITRFRVVTASFADETVWKIKMAAACKAALECTNIPDNVKARARERLADMGMQEGLDNGNQNA